MEVLKIENGTIFINHNNKTILIDEKFKFLLDDFKRCDISNYVYFSRLIKTKYGNVSQRIAIHKFICQSNSKNDVIDHINRNKLDNRQSNLRVATYQQNCWNRSPEKIDRLKGVSILKNGKFSTTFTQCSRCFIFGSFKTEYEASIFHDINALLNRGEFAYLNHENNRDSYARIIIELNLHQNDVLIVKNRDVGKINADKPNSDMKSMFSYYDTDGELRKLLTLQ